MGEKLRSSAAKIWCGDYFAGVSILAKATRRAHSSWPLRHEALVVAGVIREHPRW